MSNNLACYPLMRKGRNVDIVIAFDSSADIQVANWLGFTSGYAKQRKIKGWPVSIGWPQSDNPEEAEEELEAAHAKSAIEATEKLEDAQIQDGDGVAKRKNALGPCTVWVGNTETRDSDKEPPPSKVVEEEWDVMRPEAGNSHIIFGGRKITGLKHSHRRDRGRLSSTDNSFCRSRRRS